MKNNESDLSENLAGNVGFLLAYVAEKSGAQYHEALAAEGLEAHHVGVLELLMGGPMKQARIAEALSVFKPVVVTLVNDLEGAGFVERRPHPTDRRAVAVHLLPKGREKLTAVQAVSTAATDRFLSALTAAERVAFSEILTKLYKGLPDDDDA